MYGCFDGIIVYGVTEGNRDHVLDGEWLEEHFPGIGIYACDVVRTYMGEPVYGIPCSLNTTTGVCTIEEDEKKTVDAFASAFRTWKKEQGAVETDNDIPIGFYHAVTGDYERQLPTYEMVEEDHDIDDEESGDE